MQSFDKVWSGWVFIHSIFKFSLLCSLKTNCPEKLNLMFLIDYIKQQLRLMCLCCRHAYCKLIHLSADEMWEILYQSELFRDKLEMNSVICYTLVSNSNWACREIWSTNVVTLYSLHTVYLKPYSFKNISILFQPSISQHLGIMVHHMLSDSVSYLIMTPTLYMTAFWD